MSRDLVGRWISQGGGAGGRCARRPVQPGPHRGVRLTGPCTAGTRFPPAARKPVRFRARDPEVAVPNLPSIRTRGARTKLTGRSNWESSRRTFRCRCPRTSWIARCTSRGTGCPAAGRTKARCRRCATGTTRSSWIGLHEPDDEQITGIADTFGCTNLPSRTRLHAHNRPKLERYEDMLFAVFKTVCYVGHAPSSGTASELVETGRGPWRSSGTTSSSPSGTATTPGCTRSG